MALSDYFLAPIGLAALASIVPLLLLYLLQPDPERLELPTVRFLAEADEDESRNVVIEALRRNLLLLVQLLVLVLVALALASPYVSVAEVTQIEETVLVVDASASMATRDEGATRFDRATSAAGRTVTETTSIVVAGASTRVPLRRGPRPAAERILASQRVTGAPGDLASAVSQATAIAGEDARIVVFSDFAGGSDWRPAVEAARARGLRVDLRQFAGGGDDNVGVVRYSFANDRVTAAVRNFGDREATRTVRLGGAARSVTLAPGDTTLETFPVPDGGGELRLTPGDSFPLDDAVPIAAPSDPTIEVLVLTNDENRFLTTALSLVDPVRLTVASPPTTITRRYDVIVFSNVEPDRVLPGNVRTAGETVARGGGVAIQAQPNVGAVRYGDLLLIDPEGTAEGIAVEAARDPLVDGITFAPPERYVTGSLRDGRALVEAADGTPIVATTSRGAGRVLYYGFMADASGFKYNYMYPVFWKRAVYHLAGRPSLSDLNRPTGARLLVAEGATVAGPTGTVQGPSVTLDAVGTYRVGDRTYAAALANADESAVSAPPVGADENENGSGTRDGGDAASRTEERLVPLDLDHVVAFGAIAIVLGELIVLRRRGDL